MYSSQCPCRDLLDVVANKWSALAIGALAEGPLRFGELQRRLQGISPKVLTATLRRLEDHGLVHREVIPEVPSSRGVLPDGGRPERRRTGIRASGMGRVPIHACADSREVDPLGRVST